MPKKNQPPVNPSNKPPKPDRDKKGRFVPGNSLGKHAGRPKGSRHAISEAFLKDFCADWEEHGKQAIVDVRAKDIVQYVKIAASLVPKEYNLTHTIIEQLQEMSEDELLRRLGEFDSTTATVSSEERVQ